MSKILALGTGPLFEGGVRGFSAHCLRTWHFVKPLLDAGHDVALFTMPIYNERPETQLKPGAEARTFEGLPYQAFLNCDDKHNIARLAEACEAFKPDALLGVNSYPCATLAKVPCAAPMWADLNGSVVVEGQVKARVYGNNSLMGLYWDMEEAAIRRADKFSAVSQRQLYALLGELGAVGRMGRQTFDYPFAVHVPNAFNPAFAEVDRAAAPARQVRGKLVPENAFILLWSGSYNSWTDFDALAAALDRAMEACPDLHYVSTGGPIYGHDDLTYPRFQEIIRKSKHRARHHLLGWIDAAEVPGVYAQADLGLCVDSKNYETMFGARNRTINMMAAGLPVLTTTGAEISEELVKAGCAIGAESDAPEVLAEAIIRAYRDREGLRALGEKGRAYVLGQFSYERTTRDLVEWAKAPTLAPDNRARIEQAARAGNGAKANPFAFPINPIERRLAKLAAPPPAPNGRGGPFAPSKNRLKRIVQGSIGLERYRKLQFLRREWWENYRPRYMERREQIRRGERGKLEDLYLFLTNACNARCKHCFYIDELGHIPGELRLEDYERLAPTIPKGLRQITLTGGEAIMHPQCREITEVLARETRAARVTLISNGFLPAKLESYCCSLLEDADFPGVLDVLISIDGMEETHNQIRGNPRAWQNVNASLATLQRIKREWPRRFDFGVITIITDKNYKEIEPLDDHIRRTYRCRHGFEFVRGTSFSVWNLDKDAMTDFNPPGVALPPESEWDGILATLDRINRRAGIPNHAFHLTAHFTIEMLRTKRKIVDCVSAGQNVGVMYPKGELAVCEFSKSFGNVRDYGLDFARAWNSAEADAMREKTSRCHCTHGCYLSKNIEYTYEGQKAMVTRL